MNGPFITMYFNGRSFQSGQVVLPEARTPWPLIQRILKDQR